MFNSDSTTFTERLWWARHRPKNTDLSLIWWHLVGKLEDAMGRETSSVLGKYTNHSASAEREEECDRNKRSKRI